MFRCADVEKGAKRVAAAHDVACKVLEDIDEAGRRSRSGWDVLDSNLADEDRS